MTRDGTTSIRSIGRAGVLALALAALAHEGCGARLPVTRDARLASAASAPSALAPATAPEEAETGAARSPTPATEQTERPSPFLGPEGFASDPSAFRPLGPQRWVRDGEAAGLSYLEVVLGTDAPDAPLPLVLVLHGRGDRPAVPGGPYANLSTAVRILLPRGPQVVGDGFGWLPAVVAEGRTELLSAGLADVSARLARFITVVRARAPTAGAPIVAGFSQGGMLTLALAIRHPETVGVAFALAGWLPPPLWPESAAPSAAPPIRSMHARDDERIAFAPTVTSYRHLRSLGWDIDLHVVDAAGHRMTPEMDHLLHAWLERALIAAGTGLAEPVAPASSALDRPDVAPSDPSTGRRAGRPRRRPPS